MKYISAVTGPEAHTTVGSYMPLEHRFRVTHRHISIKTVNQLIWYNGIDLYWVTSRTQGLCIGINIRTEKYGLVPPYVAFNMI